MNEWAIKTSSLFDGKFKRYRRNHSRETEATFKNLQTFVDALSLGVKPQTFHAGFIHPEPNGVIGIAQGSLKGGAKETRLYIYVVENDREIHLLPIGSKDTQLKDINDCKKLVKDL